MFHSSVGSIVEAEKKRRKVPVVEAVGMALAHDITEIRPGEFKGRAFRRGHIIQAADVEHLERLGKESIFVLELNEDEMHEDDAALRLADALMGSGTIRENAPREGKINILAGRDGLLKVHEDALLLFNMLGEVMCATLHNNTLVKNGALVAGTRAIPLIVKKRVVEEAVAIAARCGSVIEVRQLRRPRAGVVITGNEVYYGRIKDAFAPVIQAKMESCRGEIVGVRYAPDDEAAITGRLQELIEAGADLLIVTGGMSVDPDDVTQSAIRQLGAKDLTYGSAVLPGAMFLVAYLDVEGLRGTPIPVLGIPACGIYHRTTIFDLVLPRILAGERLGRRELALLGHGGLCMNCGECRYPHCPFGRD